MKYLWRGMVVLCSLLAVNPRVADARNLLRISSSHTLDPFARDIMRVFSEGNTQTTTVYDVLCSEESLERLLEVSGAKHADIALASRQLQPSEYDAAKANGINDLLELPLGMDGIIIANAKEGAIFQLTRQDIVLALAEKVPMEGTLQPNPYKRWNQIRPTLPDQPILVCGPMKTSGTRSVFDKNLIEALAEKFPQYRDYAGESFKIRQDGAYISFFDHGQSMADQLVKNSNAVGIISWSLALHNNTKLKFASIDGVEPAFATISSGVYPFSREIFLYVRASHIAYFSALKAYVDLFLSEEMIGDSGQLLDLAFIPLPEQERKAVREQWLKESTPFSRAVP